jgi:hypothetical protein
LTFLIPFINIKKIALPDEFEIWDSFLKDNMESTHKNPKSQAFFIKIKKNLLTNEKFFSLPGSEVKLYLYLLMHKNNKSGACFPSIPTLSKYMQMSDRNVINLIHNLENSGWISIKRQTGKSNQYILHESPVNHSSPVKSNNQNQCTPVHPTREPQFTLTRYINNIKKIDKGKTPKATSQIAAFSVPKEKKIKPPNQPIKREEKKAEPLEVEAIVVDKKKAPPKHGLNKDMRGFIAWLEKMGVRLDERHYTNIQQMERRQMDAVFYQFKEEDRACKITCSKEQWLSYVVLNINDYNLDIGFSKIEEIESSKRNVEKAYENKRRMEAETEEAKKRPHRNLMAEYCQKLGKNYDTQAKIYEDRFGEKPKGGVR